MGDAPKDQRIEEWIVEADTTCMQAAMAITSFEFFVETKLRRQRTAKPFTDFISESIVSLFSLKDIIGD
ncbi:hypothetical protein AB6A23_16500 [Paenibacillus tarimensis]